MKTKSILRKAMACVLAAMLITTSATVFASDNNYKYGAVLNFTEVLQEMGLSLDLPDESLSAYFSQYGIDIMPHISRLSDDMPIRIVTEADVDILLAFAKTVSEQDLDGFTWDTCVDVALSEAGLEDYWRAGFRQVTQAAREQQLIDLALNYSVDELSEMGLFSSPRTVNEFLTLGFFQNELTRESNNEAFISNNLSSASSAIVYYGTVPSMTLSARWLDSFALMTGDSISFTVTHIYDMNQYVAGISNLAVGVGTYSSGGLYLPQEFPTGGNKLQTSSGTINMTRPSGHYFGVLCTGATPIIVSGSYQVSR